MEEETGWQDKARCKFIMLAIEYNFPQSEWEAKFEEFPEAYENAFDKEAATMAASPDNIRQLIEKRPLKEWPRKEELYEWALPSSD